MIYRDTVHLLVNEKTGVDEYGSDKYEWVDHGDIPAQVSAATTTDQVTGQIVVLTKYKVIMAATTDIPEPNKGVRVGWGPYTIDPAFADSGLLPDGGVLRVNLGGRLHHYEFTSKDVT